MGVKHYPAEFKVDTVAFYQSRSPATVKSVAGDLGVNTETLRNWIRAAAGCRIPRAATPPLHGEWGPGTEREVRVAVKTFDATEG
ncbi:transposase [Kitasatospora sp. NPDC088556]|uniref:transposase n=1 Tax=Kitasatospora sp. NPDC088556 TaxID=3364076 RepID=UPI003824F0F5